MSRTALLLLVAIVGFLPDTAVRAQDEPTAAQEATATRCFELRAREPAAAIALAESALADEALPAEVEGKLLACLARAAALAGDGYRTGAATKRIESLLSRHAFPPEYQLRALTNAGAALHTVGRIHEALDFYARAYQVAERGESDVAQVTTLINVASIHSEELGALKEAEVYYARAAAIEAGTGLADPLLPYNRGVNYLRMGRDQDALAAFADTEAKAGAKGQEVVLQRARAELVALRARPADTLAARKALADIAALQLSQQDPSGAALTQLRLSRLALAHGDAQAALREALAVKSAVADSVFRTEYRDALQAEVDALVALRRWEQAHAASENLRRFDFDRLGAQQLASLAGLQARLQDTRSAQELERLQDERRLEALRLANAKRLRNGAIAAFCLLALLAGAFLVYQRRINRKLERLSTVDSLTKLSNRRAAETALRDAEQGVADGDRRSVVYLIDVDRFKEFNDRLGHGAGDTILATIAARLRSACRPGDIVARWGGEEFLIGCRGVDRDRAMVIAERLRLAVRGSGPDGDSETVSVSIGFASLPFLPDMTRPGGWQESVTLADRALYAAKHGGRDTWVGLWGSAGRKVPLASILADPETHARAGDLSVLAARTPVVWIAP